MTAPCPTGTPRPVRASAWAGVRRPAALPVRHWIFAFRPSGRRTAGRNLSWPGKPIIRCPLVAPTVANDHKYAVACASLVANRQQASGGNFQRTPGPLRTASGEFQGCIPQRFALELRHAALDPTGVSRTCWFNSFANPAQRTVSRRLQPHLVWRCPAQRHPKPVGQQH